jgi:hypothetical protein
MAEIIDGEERKNLYRAMLKDPVTKESTRKYSYQGFTKRLLGDPELLNKVSELSVKRGWAKDNDDFLFRYAPEITTPSVPEKVPAKEVKPLTPLEQTRELARKGGLGVVPISGTQTLTDLTREQVEVPQEQAPVGVLAPEPFEPQTIEQIAAKQAVTPETRPEQKQELLDQTQALRNEKRGFLDKVKDFGSSLGASFDNFYNKIICPLSLELLLPIK